MNRTTPSPSLDQTVLDYVEGEVLEDGERIVWKGRPSPMRCLKMNAGKGVFGLIFCAFAFFWTVGAWEAGGLVGLFGLPFIAVGSFLAGVPLRFYRIARRTFYGVTNQRVLIIDAGRDIRVETLWAMNITDYAMRAEDDGTGDLQFRRSGARGRHGRVSRSLNFDDGFWGVHDAKGADAAVKALMSAIFADAKTP